jgi:hypothetical protein
MAIARARRITCTPIHISHAPSRYFLVKDLDHLTVETLKKLVHENAVRIYNLKIPTPLRG